MGAQIIETARLARHEPGCRQVLIGSGRISRWCAPEGLAVSTLRCQRDGGGRHNELAPVFTASAIAVRFAAQPTGASTWHRARQDDRCGRFVEPPEFSYGGLVGVCEFKRTSRSTYCILGRPAAVQMHHVLLTYDVVTLGSSERRHVDTEFLDYALEVRQQGTFLAKFPLSGPPAELGAVGLAPSSSCSPAELLSAAWPGAVVDEA
jgi:hypothetical protein